MRFTYDAYFGLIDQIKTQGYSIKNFHDWDTCEKCVIIRHDIDTRISRALEMAVREAEKQIKSTYFVLLTSNLYNAFSKKNHDDLIRIISLGHELGLHFDTTCYAGTQNPSESIVPLIQKEAEILGQMLGGYRISAVSMHRPGRRELEEDLEIPGMVNCYSKLFFEKFKYVSDSRRKWREPVEEIISSNRFPRMQILTHPFWYHEEDIDLRDTMLGYIKSANADRYQYMNENFTDLRSVVLPEEV